MDDVWQVLHDRLDELVFDGQNPMDLWRDTWLLFPPDMKNLYGDLRNKYLRSLLFCASEVMFTESYKTLKEFMNHVAWKERQQDEINIDTHEWLQRCVDVFTLAVLRH